MAVAVFERTNLQIVCLFCYNFSMNKIFGYLLICAGLGLIFFSLTGMYKVFVNGGAVMPVMQFADMQINTQYGPMLLPMKNLSTLANLGLFAVLMMFVLSAGSKVAQIGNGLLKTERLCETIKNRQTEEEQLKKL